MKQKFNKRIFTFKEFINILDKATYSIVKHNKNIKLINKNFRSNIMLAVTEVNGCIYCSYYHVKIALNSGTTKDEMEGLLSGELSLAKKEEYIALMFAQHYADVSGNYDQDAYQKVVKEYGDSMAKGILSTIRLIMMGNSYGIAANCLKLRLTGKRVIGSKLFNEFSILISIIIFLPLLIIKNLFTKKTD
ncbi:MAG: carboxymuconolactone decarboxylase family protein [Epsilonproteobacteria bacterium]|nr:MAG: carboxymuconolactone decarboxylase family protein [Campylobacterota bacterium]